MKINRSDLKAQLELIKNCSSKPVNEDASNKILFTNEGVINNSRGRLATFLQGEYDFEGQFPIENILNIVNNMSGDEIDLSMEKEMELKISSGKTKMTLKSDELPDEGPTSIAHIKSTLSGLYADKKFTKLPTNFIEGLQKVLKCASTDKNQTFLANVNVQGSDLIASDNFKIGHFKIDKGFDIKFLIDNYNINPVCAFEPKSYHLLEDKIIFKRGQDYQVCAINKDEYPDFMSILDQKSKYKILLPEEMKQALYLAQQIPGKDVDRQINIKQEDKKLTISCKAQTGWFRQNFSMKNKLNVSFSMNLNVLDELVNSLGNEIELQENNTGKISKDGFTFLFPIELEE